MKIKNLSALLVILSSPLALVASHETDRTIENAAKASYNYRTVLGDNVKVKADDGVVTLTGTVQGRDEKTLAQDTVENLPGVTRVKNEIAIKSEYPDRSDAWIASRIRSALLVKGHVSARNTTVNVQAGMVTLSGTAANETQRELTGFIARDIEGVMSIKNDIVVTAGLPSGEALGETIDDASVTALVKLALRADATANAMNPMVATMAGTVRLTGEASTEAHKTHVTKLVSSVRGTKSVSNEMRVTLIDLAPRVISRR